MLVFLRYAYGVHRILTIEHSDALARDGGVGKPYVLIGSQLGKHLWELVDWSVVEVG